MSSKIPFFVSSLVNNFKIKVIALLLAVVTWYAVHETINFESEVDDVPITVLHDEGWAVLEQSIDTVDIWFRGSQADIRDLKPENIQLTVDARGRTTGGSTTLVLGPRNVKIPSGARPIRVRPELVTLSLDQESEKLVPAKADITGDPPPGYDVEKILVNPATVLLRGPRERLDNIEEVRTEPIDLQDQTRSFKQRTPLVSPETTWLGRMEPEKVTVEIIMVERSATLTLENIRVGALLSAVSGPSVMISPDSVSVDLKGQPELLNEIQPGSIRAYVDCTKLEPDAEYELPVQVHTPDRISVEQVDPSSVTVLMEESLAPTHIP